ncbi:MAG: M20/M25/M40 family metallo-hydrolase [Planctomycetaceae bacterium]|nr:M20/M25/M40 family metallo-hydrolase [Planctomycetales bacterium]MCB9926665.1 M20/M25/M40 family metallo-hydrolase [Planctomycetaceae bacterium]
MLRRLLKLLTFSTMMLASLLVWELPTALTRGEDSSAVEARLSAAVKYLASDELGGRGVGTPELDQAANYIVTEFSNAGLRTNLFNGEPFQSFEITVRAELGPAEQNHITFIAPGAENAEVAQPIALKQGEDFNTLAIGGTGSVDAPVVFVGYGITAPDAEYDDYAGVDVEGKVALILRKEPQQSNPHSAFDGTASSRHAHFATKVSNAFSHGAAAVIMVNDLFGNSQAAETSLKQWNESLDELVKVRTEFQATVQPGGEAIIAHRERVNVLVSQIQTLGQKLEGDHDEILSLEGAGTESSHRKLPVFFATRKSVDSVLTAAIGTDLAALEKAIDEGPTPHSQLLKGWKVDCESNVEFKKATVKNIAGVVDGKGSLADETIIVGAHYDHLGDGGPGSLAPWTRAIHNGADDNASGTAALMEVARRVAALDATPRRRIVFMAFSGEERGLLGSGYYVSNPAIPLEKTVAMVNMDMVGRLTDNKLIISGTGTAKSFESLIDETNKRYEFDIKKDPGGYGPSDHASFYGKEIPVFHFFTGTHNDYHRPSDDVEKINVEGMQRVVAMVTDVVEHLATAESRPEYVEIKQKKREVSGDRPYLGTIPDFGREVEGYALMGASKDSPADRAGIKSGDVIIKFGDSKIGGLEDIDGALRKYKAGDVVSVIILRDGKELEVSVTLAPPR